MTLSNKQQRFVDEYLKCWNATQAAKLAGYKGNDNVLGVTGYDNLRNPKISEAIQVRLRESAMSADEVLMRLGEQARASIGHFLNEEGLELREQAIKEKGHLVKSLTHTQYGPKLELHDAQSALLNLGKYHGLFTDKLEIKLSKEVENILEIIKGVLDVDNYQRVLQAIISSYKGSSETTRPDSDN